MPVQPETQFFARIEENLYGHKKKLKFLSSRIRLWEDRFKKKPTILDVGCGTGKITTVPLGMLGYEVYGVDPDHKSIEYALANNTLSNVRFECREIQNLDGVFDVVILSEVLEHLNRPAVLLKECKRLLAQDGIILITIPNGYGPFELEKFLWKVLPMDDVWERSLLPRMKKLKYLVTRKSVQSSYPSTNTLDTSGHVQFFTKKKYTRLLDQEGLTVTALGKASFLAGPFTDTFLPKSRLMFEFNSYLGNVLSAWTVTGWYLECTTATMQNENKW